MKSNRELRQEAWRIVRGRWFWRLLTVGLVLQLVCRGVNAVLGSLFAMMSIQTWTDFLEAKAKAAQAGLSYAVPSLMAGIQMTVATSFYMFITYIFTAIFAFGIAAAALKSVKDDDNRWFADSFDGFRRPFEVTWLMLVMNAKIGLWSLLFLIPGFVAVYRYRQAWYLKNEHPDWSASKCIGESSKMMYGYKWQAFFFDISYFGWIFLGTLAICAAIAVGVVGAQSLLFGFLASLVALVALYFFLFVLVYFFVGRAVFYDDMKSSVDTPSVC